MKFLISLMFMAVAMLGSAFPVAAVDNSISALCRPGAPEAYSRPGGYCEIIASNKSLMPPGTPCPVGMYPNPNPPPKGCIPEV